MNTVYSKNSIAIRLPDERWLHIVENHDEMAGRAEEVLETIAEPDIIIRGSEGALVGAKKTGNRWVVVVYKETDEHNGFVITSFLTSKITYLLKKEIVWKKQS